MDIEAFELAKEIRLALVFGDNIEALRLADVLVELHEKAAEAEFQDWVANHPEAADAEKEVAA